MQLSHMQGIPPGGRQVAVAALSPCATFWCLQFVLHHTLKIYNSAYFLTLKADYGRSPSSKRHQNVIYHVQYPAKCKLSCRLPPIPTRRQHCMSLKWDTIAFCHVFLFQSENYTFLYGTSWPRWKCFWFAFCSRLQLKCDGTLWRTGGGSEGETGEWSG